MGDLTVTERHAYRLRNRNRRQVVAECVPDSSTDSSYTLDASDVGMSSIESVAIETPTINSGAHVVTWDDDNGEFDVYDQTGAAANTDLSGTEIVAVVTGTDE
jgi:hypothetical protein